MDNPDKNIEKPKNSTGESPFLLLSATQWRYITAMLENPQFSKKEAAEYIGLSPSTVYEWTKKAPYVDSALELSRQDIHRATLERRKQLTLKALSVKASGLDSGDETIRQKTATEILEWELGKATQKTDIGNTDGQPFEQVLTINVEYQNRNLKTGTTPSGTTDNS